MRADFLTYVVDLEDYSILGVYLAVRDCFLSVDGILWVTVLELSSFPLTKERVVVDDVLLVVVNAPYRDFEWRCIVWVVYIFLVDKGSLGTASFLVQTDALPVMYP